MSTALFPEDFTPRAVGDTGQPLVHTFTDHFKKPFDLSNVNMALITLRLKRLSDGMMKSGAGTWSTTQELAPQGIATYAWDPSDVSTEGLWLMQVGVPFPAPSGMQHFDIREIEFITPL